MDARLRRIGVFLLSIYAIASVAALVAGGRWIKTFGAGGLTVDDAVEARGTVLDMRRELEDARRRRDLAIEILLRRPSE